MYNKVKADWERRDHGGPDYDRDICDACGDEVIMRIGHMCGRCVWTGHREFVCERSNMRLVVDVRPGARLGTAWISVDPNDDVTMSPRIACLVVPHDYLRIIGHVLDSNGNIIEGATLERAIHAAGIDNPREPHYSAAIVKNASWSRRFR